MQKENTLPTPSWDISLKAATLGYGDRAVLKDIDLTLPAGKISLILGESGCGKSTLLRHIVGLNRPMSGHIFYGGRDLFALPQNQFRRVRRCFGVLFQDGALLGSLSLLDNVALPLTEHLSLPKKDLHEAALRALRLVGLGDFAHFYPSELSGGMRKRGGLARAIVTEPPVLFCDEPTSGLDPINAAQMDQLLLDMKAQYPSMTMIIVSHDLDTVFRIADHVVVIQNQKIVFTGSPKELKETKEAYIQSFVGRELSGKIHFEAEKQNPEIQQAIKAWLQE